MLQRTSASTVLVSGTDSGYRAWCRAHMQRTQSDRRRDPFAQDYNTELRRWESVVQQLLGAVVENSVDERILVSRQPDSRGRAVLRYHELDFVAGSVIAPRLFAEIKLRERTVSSKTGWSQLERSLRIARTEWPDLRGICLNIAMGELLGTELESSCSMTNVTDLPAVIEDVSQRDGGTVWVQGRDLAAFAVQSGLLNSDDVRRLPELRQAMRNPLSILQSPEGAKRAMTGPGLFECFRPRR